MTSYRVPSPFTALLLAALLPLLPTGCDRTPHPRVLHRDNCLTCHTPLPSSLDPGGPTDPNDPTGHTGPTGRTGIEDAHPFSPLTCTDCHGGTPRICDGVLSGPADDPRCSGTWIYDQDLAHVPQGDSPADLTPLVAGDLDRVDTAWLRFKNPADLRVQNQTCGRCHLDEAAAVRRSGHALQTGTLAIARLRAGLQPNITPRFAAAAVTDPRPINSICTTPAVTRFSPLLIDVASTDPRTRPSPENTQEQLLATQCMGCHIQDKGPLQIGASTRHTGTHRGSGCAACHMEYAEDGRSASNDPFVDHATSGHPRTHTLIARPSTATCVACHNQGARIGLSFQGLREVAPGQAPPDAVGFERELYGLPPGALIRDEDGTNGFDETPPDVHFEAGMDCIDCHRGWEVHGDGRIGADRTCAPPNSITRCEDCHGDANTEANLALNRHALSRRPDDTIILTTRRQSRELVVPQVKRSLDPSSPTFSPAAVAMKASADGIASHADQIACQTCHSSWIPTCYGCHIEHDLADTSRFLTTGAIVPGASSATLLHSNWSDLTLIWDSRGKLAPSMPAERVFFTLYAGDNRDPLFFMAPRSRPDSTAASGRSPSYGQRAIDPHTTRRISPFAACTTCHTSSETDAAGLPVNAQTLDLTHGFGTDRYTLEVCDVTAPSDGLPCAPGSASPRTLLRLDATLHPDGSPAVFIGHGASRSLNLDEIERMRAITAPPLGSGLPD